MSHLITEDWFTEVKKGNVAGHSVVHKFGAGALSTTLAPIDQDSTYPTPTTSQALEFLSSSLLDTSAGTGAREITIQGLAGDWSEITQTLVTSGTGAVALSSNLTRLYRWYVSDSGTYATEIAGSHAGILTIRAAGGGTVWSTIPITPFPIAQSQIGVYTVPINKTAYLYSKNIFTDTSKAADIYFFQRPLANDVTTGFTGIMRLVQREVGVTGGYNLRTSFPKGPFVGPCDIGFMGQVSVGTAECSVEFELLLVDD